MGWSSILSMLSMQSSRLEVRPHPIRSRVRNHCSGCGACFVESPAVEDRKPCRRLHPGTGGHGGWPKPTAGWPVAGSLLPARHPRDASGRERLRGERHGQEEAARPTGPGVVLGGVPGSRSRPASEAEAQGLRAGDAAPPRRARRHAGVGQGLGRQALHRVRGPRHRRQGGHDQADHRAGEPACSGSLPCPPRPSARSRRCTSSGTSRTFRPPARS